MSTSLTLRRADPEYITGLSEEEGVSFAMCLDSTNAEDSIQFFAPWHIIHYISSGTEWDMTLPEGFMIGGKYWVSVHPDEEPFRLLSAAEVKAIDRHLTDLSEDLVGSRLDALSSNNSQIYGGPVPKESFEEVIEVLDQIRQFFKAASENEQAVTKSMT